MADDLRTEPNASRRDSLVAAAVAGLVLVTVAIGALAPAPPHAPAATAPAPLAPENDPACAEWSDGCHVCRRMPEDAACSLPGIACTPGPFACTRRAAGP